MGRLVNVVLPSGRVVAVDEDVANAGQLSRDTSAEEGQLATRQLNEERSSGVAEGLKAAGEGALDTATFGAYGALRENIDPEGARAMRIRAEERPGARFAGELAAMAAPGLGEAGVLGDVGAAAELTAPGLARSFGALAGEVGGKFAARAAEGGLLGVGGYISSTNITGDPLTVEAAVESAGIGALLEVGMGVAADRIEGLTWRSKGAITKSEALQADLEVAKTGAQLFKDPPPSWGEFVDAHEAAKSTVESFNRDVEREAKTYVDFARNDTKLTKAISETRDVLDYVRNDVYAKQGGPFGGDVTASKYRLGSLGEVKSIEQTFETGAKAKFAVEEGQPRLQQAQFAVDKRPVISDATLERLKGYDQRISRIYQMKAGGWRNEAGKWIRDPGAPADPVGALEELRTVQNELRQWRPSAGDMMKQLPSPPRQPLPEMAGDLPRSLEEFARKHADQVNAVGQSVSNNPSAQAALSRVMQDLGLGEKADAVQTVTALHETLRDYRARLQSVMAEATRRQAEEAGKPLLLRVLNKAARYSIGRTVDVGGALGAVTRVLGGEAAGKALTTIEDNVLGSTLFEARQGVKQKLRTLVSKYGVQTAGLTRKLGSPMAYLSTSFPGGVKDPEKDYRRLAVNRIGEIHAAAMTAPDTAFLAVQGMLGHPSDIAWKMHQHIVGTMHYLASTLPTDPGTDTKMFGSHWTPAYHEAIALAHRLEAVNDPITAIARAIAGDSHPAATEALWAVYPNIMNELSQELSVAAPEMKNLTYQQASAYSNLFRTPLTGLQQPAVFMSIQGMYMPQPTAPQTTGGGGGAPKKAVGRPAAVQSPVAGSSVANLTS